MVRRTKEEGRNGRGNKKDPALTRGRGEETRKERSGFEKRGGKKEGGGKE